MVVGLELAITGVVPIVYVTKTAITAVVTLRTLNFLRVLIRCLSDCVLDGLVNVVVETRVRLPCQVEDLAVILKGLPRFQSQPLQHERVDQIFVGLSLALSL